MVKIGIVGFGVVGKSLLRFLSDGSRQIFVWDEREISCAERELVLSCDARFVHTRDLSLERFFEHCDAIIPSPGIDLRSYAIHNKEKLIHEKLISELDLFASAFTKKTIGITGTLGKTTVTRLLDEYLSINTACGGNIGYPMLDLVSQEDEVDWAVLELSSFQLEHSKIFAPDIALWTNFYPNHLDRHETIDEYFAAKWRLFARQTEGQHGLFPIELLTGEYSDLFKVALEGYAGTYSFVCDRSPSELPQLLPNKVLECKTVFFVKNNVICKACVIGEALVGQKDLIQVPEKSFAQNWLFVIGVFDHLGLPVVIDHSVSSGPLEAHRLELFLSHKDIAFYNDSKATVEQATRSAVTKLSLRKRPIILILGGLGKGVSRRPLVTFLSTVPEIKKVFCLGDGVPEFQHYETYASINDLVRAIMRTAARGDQVLFSPSGASFDLFKNYQERGDAFKSVVLKRVSRDGEGESFTT